jgi:DNA-binding GntR family transcriptional regulator
MSRCWCQHRLQALVCLARFGSCLRVAGRSTRHDPLSRPLPAEHQDILKALMNKDAQTAARAMYYHIKETGSLLIRELQKELPDSGDFDPQWYQDIAIPNMH